MVIFIVPVPKTRLLIPFSAALMLAMVPVKVIKASSVPSPEVKVNPLVVLRLSVPSVACKVTCTGSLPASTSEIEIRLPLAVEKTSVPPNTAF